MRNKQITKGMEVYPLIKSVNGPLSNSAEWAKARASGANVLYVIKTIEKDGMKPVFICAASKSAKTGDEFYAWDLREGAAPDKNDRKPAGKKPAKKAAKPAKKPAKKAAAKKPTRKPKQLELDLPDDELTVELDEE